MSTTYLVLLGLIAAAGVPYIAWTRLEARAHKRAAAVHADILELGDDAVPPSLHPRIDLDACIGSGACVRACPEDGVLGITDGRARLVNPLSCIGHSACMQACPVGAISLVFGTETRGVELPMLTPSFETSCPGIYIIGELTGMGLIRNATMQGTQVSATIAKAGRRGAAGDPDVLIVGAGPAGIAAALGCLAQGLSVTILEQSVFGGTIAHYPRAKVVMTGALDLPGYGTVRRKTMSKSSCSCCGPTSARGSASTSARARASTRSARTARGGRSPPRATRCCARPASCWPRRRGAPRQLGVPGEDLPKVSYRLLEPEPFAGLHALVVGGGNAAADCAIALAEAGGCASVGLSYRRTQLARMRGSVRERLMALIDAGRVTPHLGSEVTRIAPDHVVLRTGAATRELRNDAVIIQIGGTAPSELLRTIGIELVEKRGEA